MPSHRTEAAAGVPTPSNDIQNSDGELVDVERSGNGQEIDSLKPPGVTIEVRRGGVALNFA